MAQKFDKLFRRMSPEARKRVEERANAEYQALALSELREAQDLTQVQLAKKLGVDQGAVSKIEGRTDMYLSTLRNIIGAMGGKLELTARFPSGEAHVVAFCTTEGTSKKGHSARRNGTTKQSKKRSAHFRRFQNT